MMRAGKFPISTIALALLNVALIALTIEVWRIGQDNVHAPQNLSTRSLSLPNLSVLDAPPMAVVDGATIRNNAVFHSRRSFYEAPPPSPAVAAPDYDFAGTMGLPQGKRIAFVKRKADQSNRTLHVGDDLDGWRVESIDITNMVVEHDGQRYELKSAVASPGLGLVRGNAGPRVAQSNPHVLGAQGTAAHVQPPHGSADSVRTYRPPPP